jgi:hypothetical protein
LPLRILAFREELDDPIDCSDSGLAAMPPDMPEEVERGGGRGASLTLLSGSSVEYGGVGGLELV